MIISHKYRFIFIKCHKTAGTSIETYLSPLCGQDDVFTPFGIPEHGHQPRNYKGLFNPFNEIFVTSGNNWQKPIRDFRRKNKFFNHIAAFRVRCRVQRKIWDGYFKFCVERNPWDKALSHYHFIRKRFGIDVSFDTYLKEGRTCLNFQNYTDFGNPNKIIVDRILIYDNLNEELQNVFDLLGIPFSGRLGVRAKGGYRLDKGPYQENLNSDQIEKIKRIYQHEINLHNFEF